MSDFNGDSPVADHDNHVGVEMTKRSPPPPRQQGGNPPSPRTVEEQPAPQQQQQKQAPPPQQQPKKEQTPPTGLPYPKLSNGMYDYSRSLAQIKNPAKTFNSNTTICFKDVSVAVRVPKNPPAATNVFTPVVDAFNAITTLGGSCEKKDLFRIKDVSGVIRPAETVLVLSPPGHGKSSLLRALSNRIELTGGRVAYNGRDSRQAEQEGCDLKKMTQYVDQVDTHLPLLTVHETIDFAHKLTSVQYDPQRVEDSLTLLGLEECRDTIIGNAMIRGVSGGQRKRVTSGELLVSDASVLFLDEFSNGLDSSTSVDIMSGLKKFCLQYNSSIVATLQQPTPELFNLFDRLILLRDGQMVYNGPTSDVMAYLEGMGFTAPDDVDTADFIIDCLSVPRNVVLRQRQEEEYVAKKQKISVQQLRKNKPKTLTTTLGNIDVSPEPCVTTEQMVEYYETTPQWKDIDTELQKSIPSQKGMDGKLVFGETSTANFPALMPTEQAKEMYKLGYRLPLTTLLRYVLARQWTLFLRGKDTMIPRAIMAIFMSLIYGSLYYGISADDFVLRLASLVIAITQVCFGSFIEIPITCFASRVVAKQISARFYPSWLYIVSAAIAGIPMAMVEGTIYGVLLYFMTNAYREPLEFFTFWVNLVLIAFQLGTWFRCLSAVGGDEQTSQSMAGPSTGVFTIFGGLFISRSNIPDFMIWLYWISPFSWAVRGLANNEFMSARYDTLVSITEDGVTKVMRQGDVYLTQIDMYIGSEWILWGCLYLIGLAILTIAGHSWLLASRSGVGYEESIGTRRTDEQEVVDEEPTDNNADESDDALKQQVYQAAVHQAQVQHEQSQTNASRVASGASATAGGSSMGSSALKTLREALPFVPAWLSFSKLYYTVKVKNQNDETVDRILLNNVAGYAQPGKMLALMGASGAGKTTLLDVIAGLKNTGVIEGEVRINGQKTTPDLIASITGYVEQFDTLFPYSTVRETLEFAATLRLPANIPFAVKRKIVDEILEILELTSISDYIIGSPAIQSLSPAQAKRVNIGVELVANPSILFLDEPTTGLDSRSAQTVMTVVKRISRSGRAIICTIHQPSAELFYLFDRLLLLGQGGFQIYFGDLGRRAKGFVDYLQQCPGVTPIAPRVNPASWMLVELGVGVAAEKNERAANTTTTTATNTFQVEEEPEWADLSPPQRTVQKFRKIYMQSPEYQKARRRLDILESIETIDPADEAALQRHQQKVADQKAAAQKKQVAAKDDSQLSKTVLPETSLAPQAAQKANVLQQLAALFPRNFMSYWRNPPFLYARFLVISILSLVFGLIYLNLKVDTLAAATSLIGACFMGSIFMAVVHCSTATPTFFEVRATFYREKAARYYQPFLWAVCQLAIELIWMLPGSFLSTILVYWMVGLRADVGVFFSYWFLAYELALCYIAVAMFFASFCPNSATAGILQGAFMSFQSAVGGVAITLPNVPRGYVWLYHGLPGSHIFRSIIMPQFENLTHTIKVFDGTTNHDVRVKDYVSDYLGWNYGDDVEHAMWALLFIGALLVLSFIFTATIAHNKR